MRIRAGICAVALVGCAAAVAQASPALHMDVIPGSPNNGTVLEASTNPPIFQVQLPPDQGTNQLNASVATSPSLNGDGVLDPANVVAVGALHPGENPDVYSGPVPGSFASTAGQYWVQYSFPSSETEVCGGAGVPCTVASQVIAFSVSGTAASPPPTQTTTPTTPAAPTQPPPSTPGDFVLPVSPPLEPLKVWALADAKRTIPGIIRKNTKRSPRALRRDCHRAGLYGFQCRTTWHDAKYKFNGIFRLRIEHRTYVVTYRFLGKRARRSCLAKARYKSHCQYDWAF